MPESDQAAAVHAIIERVLNAENIRGSEHFERIEEMLNALPDSAGPKTVQSLLRYRVKVVKTEVDDYPVFTTGTDAQTGKYYIGIKPDPEMEPSLPWVITHEMSHILNEDPLNLCIVKTIASLGAATFATFVFPCSLLVSLGTVMLTNCVTHAIYSQRSESAADDFAIKHCSRQQLKKGLAYLELIKERRTNGIYSNNFVTKILYPSENSRIAKIRTALGFAGQAKIA